MYLFPASQQELNLACRGRRDPTGPGAEIELNHAVFFFFAHPGAISLTGAISSLDTILVLLRL